MGCEYKKTTQVLVKEIHLGIFSRLSSSGDFDRRRLAHAATPSAKTLFWKAKSAPTSCPFANFTKYKKSQWTQASLFFFFVDSRSLGSRRPPLLKKSVGEERWRQKKREKKLRSLFLRMAFEPPVLEAPPLDVCAVSQTIISHGRRRAEPSP